MTTTYPPTALAPAGRAAAHPSAAGHPSAAAHPSAAPSHLVALPRTADPRGPGTAGLRRLPPPPDPRARPVDLAAVLGFVVAVTVGLWWRHGGPGDLAAGAVDALMSLGRLTGLLAALAALGGLVLTSRPRWLERRYGQDRLLGWHRWVGTATVALVVMHGVLDTLGWGLAAGRNPVAELITLVRTEAWMMAALVGGLLMLVIGLSSWRRLRRLMSYETWYFVHLTAYLAVLLGFAHQLTLGTDIAGDTVGLIWWVALFAVTAAVVSVARWGDLLRCVRRAPLRVAAVTPEGPGLGSVHVTGPGLRGLRAAAGQFFLVRLMTPGLWWQAHPYSLSAAPTTDGLRFTVKALGDGSRALLAARPGTRVLIEGPYGVFTAPAAHGAPVLLIGGGVGVAPLRAVLEDCTPEQRPVVVVRVRQPEDLVHRAELERLVAERDGTLHVLAGPRAWFAAGDPFAPRVLQAAVPDIAHRHVYLCGPESLERAVEASLRRLRIPSAHVHRERFGI